MKLTIVGCSGSFPGPDAAASCYLLEADHAGRSWRILLDLGSGALGPLQRYVDPLAVDGVFLSHLHADHCLDLCGYHVLRRYHPDGPQPRVQVWGPAGTADRMARAYDLPVDPGMREEFDFRDYEGPGGVVELGPFRVEPIEVEHPVTAYGLRVTADGATLGYSGDTAPCAGLDEVARDADLLLAEASFHTLADNPPGIHLTGADGGAAASRVGSRRLLLTHIPPWHDPAQSLREARAEYAGPLDLARPGDVHEL